MGQSRGFISKELFDSVFTILELNLKWVCNPFYHFFHFSFHKEGETTLTNPEASTGMGEELPCTDSACKERTIWREVRESHPSVHSFMFWVSNQPPRPSTPLKPQMEMGRFGGGCGNSEAEERLFSYFPSFPGGWCRQEILRWEAQPLPGVAQGLVSTGRATMQGSLISAFMRQRKRTRRKGSLPTSAPRKTPRRRP